MDIDHHQLRMKIKRMFFIKGNQIRINEYLEIIFCRNPVLNKSFDILPEIKDDDPSSDNSVSEILSRIKKIFFFCRLRIQMYLIQQLNYQIIMMN
jgi:hypothetical protein